MAASRDDVRSMVLALFTLISSVERARRQKKPAAALDLLQVIAAGRKMRPSDIADQRSVHRSLVTRQLRELEDAGYVSFAEDPDDGRSWLATLTPAGYAEMVRLQDTGLDRFALFVADWEPEDVRHLTALLTKLSTSMAGAADHEGPPAQPERRRRSRRGHRDRAGRP